MADEQAYAGNGGIEDAHGEYARMRFIVEQVANRMATVTLVLVKAYDADKKTVDVQPMVAQLDGAGSAFPHGVINSLPVWALHGGDSAIIVTPKVGDIGLAAFCHSDISSVKETKKPAPPGSRRRFDWADGVYLGGVLNAEPTQFIRFSDDGIEITSPDDRPIIITAGGNVEVVAGGDASIDAEGNVSVTAGGDVQVSADGDATVQGGTITLDGNAVTTGDMTVNGTTTMTGGFTAAGGGTIGGKSFATHQHTGVTVGTGDSGPVK